MFKTLDLSNKRQEKREKDYRTDGIKENKKIKMVKLNPHE